MGYWNQEEFERLDQLANRGIQAVAKLQRYLRSPKAKRNAKRRYRSNDPNDPNVPISFQVSEIGLEPYFRTLLLKPVV